MFTVSVVVYRQLGFKLQRSHTPSPHPTLEREHKDRDYGLRQQFSESQQQWNKKLTATAKILATKEHKREDAFHAKGVHHFNLVLHSC